MRECYTRPCNFYYGNYARRLIAKKKGLPLAGNPNIAFDQLEIFQRKKRKIIKSNSCSIFEIDSLSKEKKTVIKADLKKITSKRKNIRGLKFNSTQIMGILNVTPDSFSDGGLFLEESKAHDQVRLMIESGATIIDIGGESTRPGSKTISDQDEWNRIKNIVIKFKKNFYLNKRRRLKILHISNFGNWLYNRLYFISIAKKLSNGFIRSGHDVLDLSDRDVVRYNRVFPGIKGHKYLNTQILETTKNYSPDLILLGHSYNIENNTFEKIKSINKNIIFSQWFEDHLADFAPDYLANRQKLFKYQNYIKSNFITTHPSALSFLKNNDFNGILDPSKYTNNSVSIKVSDWNNNSSYLNFRVKSTNSNDEIKSFDGIEILTKENYKINKNGKCKK